MVVYGLLSMLVLVWCIYTCSLEYQVQQLKLRRLDDQELKQVIRACSMDFGIDFLLNDDGKHDYSRKSLCRSSIEDKLRAECTHRGINFDTFWSQDG